MMDAFLVSVWFGGMFAPSDAKVGFTRRLTWPLDFGAYLFALVLDYEKKRGPE